MILVDSNFLISGTDSSSDPARQLAHWCTSGEPLATSAIAWMEFLSGPVSAADIADMRLLLDAGILPFGDKEAAAAANLFNLIGRRRALRADCMIAASSLASGASLATRNLDDFRIFVPHGLRLAG